VNNTSTAARFGNARTVSERTGIAIGTLANWRSARTGPPYVKLPGSSGKVLYDLEALDRWLLDHSVGTLDVPPTVTGAHNSARRYPAKTQARPTTVDGAR